MRDVGTRTSLRKPTQYDRLLAILNDRKLHTAAELYATGCVLHSRISVLRKRGYVIELTRADGVGAESFLYRLIAAPSEVAQSPRLTADQPPVRATSLGADGQLSLLVSAAAPRARNAA